MTTARDRIRVAVLGSTGSIGRQALDVLAAHEDRFEVVGLAAGRGGEVFDAQVAEFAPAHVATADDGQAALADIAVAPDVDMVIVGTSGIVSLVPTLAALEQNKVVATANKETLVAGGHLVMPLANRLAQQSGAATVLSHIRPIDSEHCAIWQCLNGEKRSDVTRLILTGSGGPFREWQPEQLAHVTKDDALKHPTWRMGPKITVDSATLMNKALEVIEARWLYDVEDDQIDVVIHPQSVIHSMVEFADGSIKAQLGLPDMRIPIQYAVTYPDHLSSPAPRIKGVDFPTLTFEPVDPRLFPALAISREAGRRGPAASAALIAADDVAVDRFLDGSLTFPAVSELCAAAIDQFGDAADPNLEQLLALDAEVRSWAATWGVPATSKVS